MNGWDIPAVVKTGKAHTDCNLLFDQTDGFFCEPCVMGKQSRKPHKEIKDEKHYKAGENCVTYNIDTFETFCYIK